MTKIIRESLGYLFVIWSLELIWDLEFGSWDLD
jgi:hypothetical protein